MAYRDIMKILALTLCILATVHSERDLTLEPGHLKPFGEGRPSTLVEEYQGFPNPHDFFENYVKPLRPLKMVGAAKLSPAFSKWTDDYFLSKDEPYGNTVSVETMKKEDRKQNVLDVPFQDFVRGYNTSENYMVDSVPAFIKDDVVVPCPLQCKELVEKNFVDNVMWFSSGGTKSVVHTDGVDNINCLFRGNKTLIMVDPKHSDKVDLDRPEGSYSTIDVDHVDFTKFPGIASVEYYHVNITAGDCLYIPFLWIHQVRSFGSNLAVNVWWRHHLTEELDYSRCNAECDKDLTLKDAKFGGFGDLLENAQEIRDHLSFMVGEDDTLSFQKMLRSIIGGEVKNVKDMKDIVTTIHEAYSLLDADKDGIVTKDEVTDAPNEIYEEVSGIYEDVQIQLIKYFDANPRVEDPEEVPYDGDPDEEDLHDEL